MTDGYIRCKLPKTYEPNRRYVGQFGVDRAPALIVVHGDGTYHARSGSMSAADVAAFLAHATPPGQRPEINPYIKRRVRYEWHRSIEEAEEEAQQTGRAVFTVFYRSFSSDWQVLRKLLSRQEVYSRLADMVHCRIGVLGFSGRAQGTRFGALTLPAVVIAHRDGTHDALELPQSYEAIVRFADTARRREGTADVVSTGPVSP